VIRPNLFVVLLSMMAVVGIHNESCWRRSGGAAASASSRSHGCSLLAGRSARRGYVFSEIEHQEEAVFFDDCRWKTQVVVVDGNAFGSDSSNIPRGVVSKGCGFNGLFSNYGTYPRWSPYKGISCKNNMLFKQNSVWRNNT
jgi:hypothetical protein